MMSMCLCIYIYMYIWMILELQIEVHDLGPGMGGQDHSEKGGMDIQGQRVCGYVAAEKDEG